MGKYRETYAAGAARRPPLPCNAKGCSNVRYGLAPWCRTHRERIRHQGAPTVTAPPRAYRKLLRKLVRQALDGMQLPVEVLTFLGTIIKRLETWESRLVHRWEAEAAGRLARMDPLDLLAAVTAWRFYEDEVRDYRRLRAELPDYFTQERLRRFERAQCGIWLRDSWTSKGFPQQAAPRAAMNRVVGMLLAFRTPTKLLAVSHRLAVVVRPRILAEMAKTSRAESEKSKKVAAKARLKTAPFGINPDGTRDIYRSSNCMKDRTP